MILADTSVWVDHLRRSDNDLKAMLLHGQILTHPFVIGELAMGSLKNRAQILSLLDRLPKVVPAREDEVLRFVSGRKLHGLGIGYIDAHLLAAVVMTPGTLLWTRDKRLHRVAESLALSFDSANA